MMILALEFSSAVRSVALLRGTGMAPAELLGALSDEGARSVKPLSLVDKLLTGARTRRDAIEAVAVGLGPGSYTGIRSSIALAQGWQLARGVQLTGVSSVECLALQAQAKGWFGPVTIAIDAQRNEFYLAGYLLAPEQRALIEPLRLISRAELHARISQPECLLIGPEANKWSDRARVLYPEAAVVGRLVPAEFASIAGENLTPIYLRESTFVKAPPARVLPQ